MFKKITDLFQNLTTKETEQPDPERLSYLAATALMIELSRADNSIDQQEIQTIIAIATDTFGLSEDEAADILSEAELKNAEGDPKKAPSFQLRRKQPGKRLALRA